MSGPHRRGDGLLPEERAAQIFEIIDPVAEPARKIGGTAGVSVEAGDAAATSLLAEWIDRSEEPRWFRCETTRRATGRGP